METLNLFKHALINGVGSRASGYEVVLWEGEDAALAYNAVKAQLFLLSRVEGENSAAISASDYFGEAVAIGIFLNAFVTPDQDVLPLIWTANSETFHAYSFSVFRGPATLIPLSGEVPG